MTSEPDWEGFARRIMVNYDDPGINVGTLHNIALKYRLIRPVDGGFDPQIHYDHGVGIEAGDPWFVLNYEAKP